MLKLNNYDDENRSESVYKLNEYIKNDSESRNKEKDIYNHVIEYSKGKNICKSWNNPKFKELYYDKINILCLNLKYNMENININMAEHKTLERIIRKRNLKKHTTPSHLQTKEWRRSQPWYRDGKRNECEIYQREQIEKRGIRGQKN